MRIHPTVPRHAIAGLAAALVLCLAAEAASASPDEATDAVLHLLRDKGLIAESPAMTTAATAASTEASSTVEAGLLRRMHDRASDLTIAAMDLVGIRYVRGGTSTETGFDCSGFTRHVFETSLGLVLPRRADEQAAAPGLVAVKREDLRPGDLVFFNTLKRTFSHVGIYIGENRFVHSPRPGKSVRTDDMTFAYWAKRFTGARRADATVAVAATIAAPARPAVTGAD